MNTNTNDTIYTTTEAVQDGYVVRFQNSPTFLDLGDVSYVQAEYGIVDGDNEFQSLGFCYEA